jgi:hypothetical protein
MKRLIVMAVAAGGLAVGSRRRRRTSAPSSTTSSASVRGYTTRPAVVAGTGVYVDPDGRQVYTVPNGTAGQVYVDPDGRQVYVQSEHQTTASRATTPGPADLRQQRVRQQRLPQLCPGQPRDRDGDGVINRYDRYPDDPRYR